MLFTLKEKRELFFFFFLLSVFYSGVWSGIGKHSSEEKFLNFSNTIA